MIIIKYSELIGIRNLDGTLEVDYGNYLAIYTTDKFADEYHIFNVNLEDEITDLDFDVLQDFYFNITK